MSLAWRRSRRSSNGIAEGVRSLAPRSSCAPARRERIRRCSRAETRDCSDRGIGAAYGSRACMRTHLPARRQGRLIGQLRMRHGPRRARRRHDGHIASEMPFAGGHATPARATAAAMRVVAGHYGGRRLIAPPGDETRPTSDRVREALFSVLGAVGPGRARARPVRRLGRAGHRGALARRRRARSSSTARAKAIEAVRANLAALGIEAEVRRDRGARVRCARHPRAREAYDLVFLDPPYRRAAELGRELSEGLAAVLAPGARVVTESDRRDPLELDTAARRRAPLRRHRHPHP